MAKSKRKKNKLIALVKPEEENREGSITNLPEKCIQMNIKTGTKMRNVLEYAMKEFPNHNAILWTAAGEGIGKTISCVEIFKRKFPGLHQVTKLGSIESKKSLEEKDKDGNVKIRYVAQINILLTREATHKNEFGYQAPNDTKMFWKAKNDDSSKSVKKKQQQGNENEKLTIIAAGQFTEMGLRTGQKRSRKEQHTEAPLKKKKRKTRK